MIICDVCPRESATPATVRAAVVLDTARVQDGEPKGEVVRTLDLCQTCHRNFVPGLRAAVTRLVRRDTTPRQEESR